jgi:hypothetical protein
LIGPAPSGGAGKAFSANGDFEMIKSILENPVARMAKMVDPVKSAGQPQASVGLAA